MLSTIPCSGFLYLQFLARCHPYILISFLMIFTLVLYRGDPGLYAIYMCSDGNNNLAWTEHADHREYFLITVTLIK